MKPATAALLALALGLAAPAGAEQGCRPGTQEYTRQTIGNATHIWCVCAADLTRLRGADDRLRALDEQIKRDREAIEAFQAEVPEYLASLDDWVKEDAEGRKEKMARARSAALSIALQSARLGAIQLDARMSPADVEAMWARINAGPLGSPAFQEVLRRVAPGAALRPWHTADDALEGLEIIHKGIEGMQAGASGQYGEAALAAVSLLARDPKVAILIAELDFTATAIVTNATARVARARVDQLVSLGEQRLKAIAALSKTYRQHIDERKRLQQERSDTIARGSNPNSACP